MCDAISGDCPVCEFFEESVARACSPCRLEPPTYLFGSVCTCMSVFQVNDCGGACKCSGPGSCHCGSGVVDRPGITPLHIACSRAHLDIVQFLLERGAAVNAVTLRHSRTPLQVCNFFQTIHICLCTLCHYMGSQSSECFIIAASEIENAENVRNVLRLSCMQYSLELAKCR